MKICLVHEEYPEETNFGGIATYQKILAEELAINNDVIVICRSLTNNKHYFENGVEIYRIYNKFIKNQIKWYKNYRKKVSKLLKKLQQQKKIDIIEVPDWGAETVFFEKYRRVPLVVRLHTPLKVWLKYNNSNFGKVTNTILNWEEKMINSADFTSCCSNALKKIIVNEFDIDASRIHVNPNPANVNNFYRNSNIPKENILLYVGSMEERKGVCVLANALNRILDEIPDLKVYFIGKDTNRNNCNFSTIKLVKQLVDFKYSKNLYFLGQKPNSELNYYFNIATVGVFPSLFDNFPYVVLEAMLTGLNIVGSSNSGMVEMLNDDSAIYKAGDSDDLAVKIINTYKKSKSNGVNISNINRVKKFYDSKMICKAIYNQYQKVIEIYNSKQMNSDEVRCVLSHITKKIPIVYKKNNFGIANTVYVVKTFTKSFIIKKYLYNYDFDLINTLYEIYKKNNINVICPINKKSIYYKGHNYNIFEYKKSNCRFDYSINYFCKLVSCDRIYTNKSKKIKLSDKIEGYEEYLRNIDLESSLSKEITFVIDVFDEIKNDKMFKEVYINHGDISINNIIINNKKVYLIDFDETCLANQLYDFAVIAVKFFTVNGNFVKKKLDKFIFEVKKQLNYYNVEDFYISIQYYLCKLLLEKFYLHCIEKIDLFNSVQMQDDYKIYLQMLKNIYIRKEK